MTTKVAIMSRKKRSNQAWVEMWGVKVESVEEAKEKIKTASEVIKENLEFGIQVTTFEEVRTEKCILNVESPSFPPTIEELKQCGCAICLAVIQIRQTSKLVSIQGPVMCCLKCGADSGDDWSQCNGKCPQVASPHYVPDLVFKPYTERKEETRKDKEIPY